MTPIRHTLHPITRAIFFALWAVVLVTRMVPVDARVLKGNPAQSAPRPPCPRQCMPRLQACPRIKG
jgi:hypothetical protein